MELQLFNFWERYKRSAQCSLTPIYNIACLSFTTALLRSTDRSSPLKKLYLSDTFPASALMSIRRPDSLKFFLTGRQAAFFMTSSSPGILASSKKMIISFIIQPLLLPRSWTSWRLSHFMQDSGINDPPDLIGRTCERADLNV